MSTSPSLSEQIRLFIFFIFSVLSLPLPLSAQVVPDNTLPNNSQVTTEGNTNIIEGGTSSGNNLFHSFDSFSVPTGGTAYFNNAQAIQNIFSRVTGSSISNIDGLIKANGNANLFLLNPNGILFGSNASLNLGGSFFATTASSIKFADGVEFSATNPQVNPALTVSVPVGLGFASNPGAITVKGTGNNLSYDPQTFEAVRDDRPVGLQVNKGKTLALVGGDISLEGGNLTAEEGRIELGSVGGNETVNLALNSSGWKLGYENVNSFQDIQLSGAASVDSSGNRSGDIQVQGRQITLSNGSAILANTLGNANGGNITVKASEQIQTSGISSNNSFPSGIYTDIASGATGKGGNLTINTGRLEITDGSQIGSGTFGAGDAGELNITAQDVEVVGAGASAPSALFVSAQSGSTGKGGNLTINTDRLKLADGAQISSGTFGAGDAGELNVTAQDVEVVGKGASATSGLFSDATQGSTGKGGNLTIKSELVRVTDGAKISSRSRGSGQAGNIDISANQIESDQGSITVSSNQSGGGDINLKTGQLFLDNNSSISTSVQDGTGEGGNLTIDTDTLVGLNNSELTTNAVQGAGGNIAISAEGIFGSSDSNIDVNSQFGIDGEININSSVIFDFQNSLNPPISPKFIVVEEAIQGSCLARRNQQQGSFVYAGTGGLPENPSSATDEEESLSVRLPEPKPTSNASEADSEEVSSAAETVIYPAQTALNWQIGDPIIEPTNLIKTADGRLLWVRKGVDDISSQICQ
jgi:filamentous hemagglutinin family protein